MYTHRICIYIYIYIYIYYVRSCQEQKYIYVSDYIYIYIYIYIRVVSTHERIRSVSAIDDDFNSFQGIGSSVWQFLPIAFRASKGALSGGTGPAAAGSVQTRPLPSRAGAPRAAGGPDAGPHVMGHSAGTRERGERELPHGARDTNARARAARTASRMRGVQPWRAR